MEFDLLKLFIKPVVTLAKQMQLYPKAFALVCLLLAVFPPLHHPLEFTKAASVAFIAALVLVGIGLISLRTRVAGTRHAENEWKVLPVALVMMGIISLTPMLVALLLDSHSAVPHEYFGILEFFDNPKNALTVECGVLALSFFFAIGELARMASWLKSQPTDETPLPVVPVA